MNNVQESPRIKKESKNKIKVEFERTPLKDRLKAKFINGAFVGKVVWYIFRLVLLIGISYIVLYPFFSMISGSVMAPEDFVDVRVRLIPMHFTLDTYRAILANDYWEAFGNTLLLSASTALIQYPHRLRICKIQIQRLKVRVPRRHADDDSSAPDPSAFALHEVPLL